MVVRPLSIYQVCNSVISSIYCYGLVQIDIHQDYFSIEGMMAGLGDCTKTSLINLKERGTAKSKREVPLIL